MDSTADRNSTRPVAPDAAFVRADVVLDDHGRPCLVRAIRWASAREWLDVHRDLEPQASTDGQPRDAVWRDIDVAPDLGRQLAARADAVQARLRANQRTINRSLQLLGDVAARYGIEVSTVPAQVRDLTRPG